MNPEDAITELEALPGGDPEGDHNEADAILLRTVPPEVRAAYERLQARCRWWATA